MNTNTTGLRWFSKILASLCLDAGLEIKIFSREPGCIFESHFQMLCIETSTSLGSLQKFEGAAGEFMGALGSRHPLISSPEMIVALALEGLKPVSTVRKCLHY